jgi:hypothetical protein
MDLSGMAVDGGVCRRGGRGARLALTVDAMPASATALQVVVFDAARGLPGIAKSRLGIGHDRGCRALVAQRDLRR